MDLHGPSIPRILGLKGKHEFAGNKGIMLPVRFLPNLEVISIETLTGENKDSPPGTGDEPLTAARTIPDARDLIATTPQEVSLADVKKSINNLSKWWMKS